jgi:erythromycin esterase
MSRSAPTHTTLNDWIAHEAIPFSVETPGTFNDAVDKVITALGDSVELLGFGEALHGSEEILILRNRLFQRLVETYGYTAIAIESSFPRSRTVNEYVNGRGPSSYASVQDTGFGNRFGQLAANRELVEWMRQYNADPSHTVKINFYGFDIPTGTTSSVSPRLTLYYTLDYLDSMDSATVRERRERIDSLIGADSNWENPMDWRDSVKSAELLAMASGLRIEIEDLISELHVRRPELVANRDEDHYLEAVQHAIIARQLMNFYIALARGTNYAASLGVRDALMADNLAYIVSRERSRGHVFAFAHNKHLQHGQAQWQMGLDLCVWWPAGSHLNDMFGSRYAVIGSAIGSSDDNGIGQPEPDTLEARLTAAPGPARFIPTHKGQGLPGSELATLPTRSRSMKNPTYFPLTSESFTDFHWLVILDSTTYNRGGPVLR